MRVSINMVVRLQKATPPWKTFLEEKLRDMLEPRESDIPALFLVLVVLPLVAYILLGKWSEVSKRNERVNLLAHIAVEESRRAEAMLSASVMPFASPLKVGVKIGNHECALCHGPATTQCSRCNSGTCQIVHWRKGHKEDCLPLESFSSPVKPASVERSGHSRTFSNNDTVPELFIPPVQGETISDASCSYVDPPVTENTVDTHPFDAPILKTKRDKYVSRKSIEEKRGKDLRPSVDTSKRRASADKPSNYNFPGSRWHKQLRGNAAVNTGDSPSGVHDVIEASTGSHVNSSFRSEIPQNQCQRRNFANQKACSLKLAEKTQSEQTRSGKRNDGHLSDKPKAGRKYSLGPAQCDNVAKTIGFMKMMGLKKSSKSRKDASEVYHDNHKRTKMLFSYEEFSEYFQCENFHMAPRGLLNCGNSCYANAILQCLTCTKPLLIYLLKRTHSSCSKNWCLMCELEQLVMMLRESMDPLSPSGILHHLRTINNQIGDGSQEDAHEFLRLLVTSMQSICLEEMGGEKPLDPFLQETTFIQHTFGGRLRSKVNCLNCQHESERYENIMDLTLEIFGWVESLEDALTQFTALEDLDGDNMYRCESCASYVRARKQLSIDEAPNILTIVLKRFQEGSYGKINKCVRFPEMLDMIPYMTGTNDIPPLYVLYAMVVHMDTLNASFSGHYVSYVKDMQGNWFRIDDAEVQQVPMGQVMSEGAYILFYMRSFPRPAKSTHMKHCGSNFHRSSTPGVSLERRQPSIRSETAVGYANHAYQEVLRSANQRFSPIMQTSSDWSLFTSSDDASFTTESTSDSYSADNCNIICSTGALVAQDQSHVESYLMVTL
ncbi:Ubiquitin carboxyl-terminal hydrolase 15-like protein [Drosera capensis]